MIKTDILILGSGIGGFSAFQTLKNKVKGQKILLVDKNNYLTFSPMLHEVASGSIQPNHCTTPIREYIYKTPHDFLKAKVKKIIAKNNIVRTNKGDIEFKYCITALGSHVNFHKIPGAQKFSHHVRTLEAAVKLHKTFTKKLEEQKEIAINIVGGGATGVEMAGQFGDLKNHEIRKLYPDTKININLIQNSDKIIAYSSKETQKSVKRKLEEYKVNITFNSLVKEVTKDKIVLANDKVIKSDLTIWTAGFYCNGHELINSTVNGGRLVVNEFLQTNKHHNIFAIGDMSFVKQGKEDQCGYPQTGEIAYQQGKTAAKNLIKLIENEHLEPFTYESKGMLIPVGDWYAAAEVKNVKFTGRFAWWLRRTVYLISMPGLVRKLRIVSDWTLNAFGMKRVSEE